MVETSARPPVVSRAMMQQLNAVRVLHELRQHGALSAPALSEIMHLSKPTIYSLLDLLENQGYIGSSTNNQRNTGAGRRGLVYSFRSDYGYVLGADIGADKILVMVADLFGAELARVRVDRTSKPQRDTSETLANFRYACSVALEQAGVSAERLLSVVVGIPGVLAEDGTVSNIPQIPEWEGYAPQRELQADFACPVVVEREVNLLVRAEQHSGSARELSNVVVVQLGIGIGAGFLVNGEVVSGANGAAGEIGSMPIGKPDPDQHGFGQFEWASGGAGIAARGKRVARESTGALLAASGQDTDAIDAALVFASARSGDRSSLAIVNDAVDTLSVGLAMLVCAFNPQTVILSGGMTASQDLIVPRLSKNLEQNVPYPPPVVVSKLTDIAVPLGAIRLGLEIAEPHFQDIPELVV